MKIFEDGPVSVVNAIRQSTITPLSPVHKPGEPGAGFEVTTRNNDPGPPRIATMYLRWIDEGSTSATTATD
jgi:hypothetical protein